MMNTRSFRRFNIHTVFNKALNTVVDVLTNIQNINCTLDMTFSFIGLVNEL